MPTYGPWQESREHVETIYARSNSYDDPENVAVLEGEQPTQRSGWSLAFSNPYDVTASITTGHEGNISNPPPPDGAQSQDAFSAVLNTPVTEGLEMQYRADWYGGTNHPSPGNWSRWHGWTLSGAHYEMGWTGMPESDEYFERLAVPPGFPVYVPDEYTVELEGAQSYRQVPILLEASVLSADGGGPVDLFVKDVNITSGFVHLGPTSIEGSKIARAPYALDHEALNDWMDVIESEGGTIPGEPTVAGAAAMPKMAVLWDAGPVGVAQYGSGTYTQGSGLRVAVRLRWTLPRWRQVFFEDPPPEPVTDYVPAYRRTFPRDDQYGTSAPRTYPPPRSEQGSNRTFGGYL